MPGVKGGGSAWIPVGRSPGLAAAAGAFVGPGAGAVGPDAAADAAASAPTAPTTTGIQPRRLGNLTLISASRAPRGGAARSQPTAAPTARA